ncbi:hypothetical protein [Frigoriflavimonas asaccharolytica]|uniref:Uncharacterized protein n=1 Tax=Frigoriflavimonas asaccharolytica TaxID=2735899 RepID=A0A8J8KCT7_9FLAO|nr:hypothetical protein [Frigoriflavimonas asaccharolytica]NRS94009.1 hypothetical protein [Frigoriflavimonas asaccharolytica]
MIFKTVAASPKKKFSVGKFLLLLLILDFLIIIALAIIAYLPQYHRTKDLILQSTFGFNIGLVVILFLLGIYYIFFRNKDKEAIGTLQMMEEKIMINDTTFPIFEIENLRIVGNDILGEFRGFKSKGTNNEIFIILKNGEEISSNFVQTTETSLKNAENILNIYHEKGLLTESNLENILNNTNYY